MFDQIFGNIAVLCFEIELSMDRNRNLFLQEYVDFLGTGGGMELFCGLQGQEFRLTVKKMLRSSCLDCLFQFSSLC